MTKWVRMRPFTAPKAQEPSYCTEMSKPVACATHDSAHHVTSTRTSKQPQPQPLRATQQLAPPSAPPPIRSRFSAPTVFAGSQATLTASAPPRSYSAVRLKQHGAPRGRSCFLPSPAPVPGSASPVCDRRQLRLPACWVELPGKAWHRPVRAMSRAPWDSSHFVRIQ